MSREELIKQPTDATEFPYRAVNASTPNQQQEEKQVCIIEHVQERIIYIFWFSGTYMVICMLLVEIAVTTMINF